MRFQLKRIGFFVVDNPLLTVLVFALLFAAFMWAGDYFGFLK